MAAVCRGCAVALHTWLQFFRAAFVAGILLTSGGQAQAIESFVVRDIRLEGLQRTEPGTVFASLPVRIGDTYTDDKAAASIRALFALGLFKDVRIDVRSNDLVVMVEERPTIGEVDFTGAKEFDKDVLKKALKEIGLTFGRPFDKALVDKAEQELKRQYVNKSMYTTEVTTTVTPVEGNRVNLSFAVVEGSVARIQGIRIVGNKIFSESTLRGLFDQDAGGWLSWYTKSDRYSRAKLNADIEALRSYYLSRGYLEFQVNSTQVAIAPNKQDVSVTINITEGECFVVSRIKLAGNYLEKQAEFQSQVLIRVGEPYNGDQVASTVKAFTEYFGNFGYAFARVEPKTEIDHATNRVEITLDADPSRRVYVRRINIAGNDRTRDEVIRREFRQFEAAWYDGNKIKQSRNRIDRLGYFKEVSLDTLDVPGSPDMVDLLLTVAEKPTGSLSVGAGVSSADGLGVQFGFKQDNAFGSGKSLGVELNTSKYNRTVVFNTTDPYFTEDGISRTIDVSLRTSKPYADANSYAIETAGAALRFGVPITEYDTVFMGLGVDRTTIVPGSLLPSTYQSFADEYGYSSLSVPLTLGWGQDSRDSALAPSSGRVTRLSGEWSVAGALHYARATAQFQQFYPLTKKVTAAFNGEVNVGFGTDGQDYPLFKNFYSGGLGSVRGFEPSSLTTKSQRQNEMSATGGTKKLTFNAELLSPFPGGGNDKSLRAYAFVDAGGLYGAEESMRLDEMRVSTGVGISWISPVGPLRLSYAQPFRKFRSDRVQSLQFQIGTSF